MAEPEVLTCVFHEQDPIPAPRRTSDNLSQHVKGIAQWYPEAQPAAGYYIPKKYSSTKEFKPLKFINNQWFGLFKHESSTTHLCTWANTAIPINNQFGLGYWDITEPQHPHYTSNLHTPIAIDPPKTSSSSSSDTSTVHAATTAIPPTPAHYNTPTPRLSIASTSTAPTSQVTSTAPISQPMHMSTSTTGTGSQSGGGGRGGGSGGSRGGGTGTAPTTSNGGMWGVPPVVFDGMCTLADKFWAQFRWYKMVNHTHDSITKPFNWVLIVLTYIRGLMINNWVNAQETHLSNQTDATKPNTVREDNEVLWTEFKTAFTNAWTDTSKKQNAYDQLMKLTMIRWDIDTYIATFEWLTLAAGWALDTKGTIIQFQECYGHAS